jgi:DNA-binding NarL/FixJ family response regulator
MSHTGLISIGVDVFRPGAIEVHKIRLLVADDLHLWREFIFDVLQKEPSFEVVCQAVDGLQAVQAAKQHQPRVALLDIGLPRMSGIEAARSIKTIAPQTEIIFLSEQRDTEVIQAALDLGSGYVLKSDAASDLITAIHSVARDETFVSRQVAGLTITGKHGKV